MARRSFKKKPPKWLGLTILFILIGILSYYGWARWLNYELSEAKRELNTQQYDEALTHVKRLRFLQPTSPVNEFLFAAAIRKTDPEATLEALEQLVNDPKSSFFKESALIYLELAIQLERHDQADEIIKIMALQMSDNPQFMMLRARRLSQQGKMAEAMEELTYLLNIKPNNSEAQWIRAEILLSQPHVTNWIEAKSALKEAGATPDHYGKRALLALGSRPEIKLFPDEREWLIRQIEKHPHDDINSRLMAATQKIILAPQNKGEIMDQVIHSDGIAHSIFVSQWLLALNESELATGLIQQAKKEHPLDQELWKLEYRAAVQSNDLERLTTLIKEGHAATTDIQSQTLQALINLSTSESESTEPWQKAYNIALESQEYSAMLVLARSAANQEWWSLAEKSYEQAMEFAGNQYAEANLKREYITVLMAQKKTEKVYELSSELRKFFPLNPVYQNNYFYLGALLGKGNSNQAQEFSKIMAKLDAKALNATLAYLLYLDGDYTQATARLRYIPEWLNQQADVRLLKGLIAAKSGDTKEALTQISAVNPANLLPQENELRNAALKELAEVN